MSEIITVLCIYGLQAMTVDCLCHKLCANLDCFFAER